MVKHNRNDILHFKTINGQNVILNLKKSHGCLCLSIRIDINVFSYKNALLLGFAICALMLNKSKLDPVYLATLFILLLVFFLYKMSFNIREERVLIVKGLGYQLRRKFLIRNSTTFIPYEQVQTIFINEVIVRHRVIYILSLMVQQGAKEHKLIPLFKDILPRLDCVEVIYKNIKRFEDS